MQHVSQQQQQRQPQLLFCPPPVEFDTPNNFMDDGESKRTNFLGAEM